MYFLKNVLYILLSYPICGSLLSGTVSNFIQKKVESTIVLSLSNTKHAHTSFKKFDTSKCRLQTLLACATIGTLGDSVTLKNNYAKRIIEIGQISAERQHVKVMKYPTWLEKLHRLKTPKTKEFVYTYRILVLVTS